MNHASVAKGSFVVAGALAQRPQRAGHAWVFLHWMLGARACGWKPLFVDRMNPEMGPVDTGVEWVATVMGACGFDDAWSVDLGGGQRAGLSSAQVLSECSGGVLLDVMGYLDDDEVRDRVACAVFLDIDPGFGQVWQAQGLACLYGRHDYYATVGLNLGKPGCVVPDLQIDWIPTLPPVDPSSWRCDSAPAGPFTTVASWRGPFAPVELGGEVYGLRVHAARPLAELPHHLGTHMEMALDIDPADDADRGRLVTGGWVLRDPAVIGGDLDTYRQYVQGSVAEFGIAKEVYVAMRTGWFSDRSACYLASGRSVIVSDTGLDECLPVGDGLHAFGSVDDAMAAIEAVCRDPARHGRAATAIARELFDAERVVGGLLEAIS